jgi:hypothetical protein
MSDKQSIIRDIRKEYGYLLNLREAGEVLGFTDLRATRNFLEGLPYCEVGRQKKFLASDIGGRIYCRLIQPE